MIMAIIVSFLAGSTIVFARTVNARLAMETSLWTSTFYNYFVGLLVSVLVLFLLGGEELRNFPASVSPRIWTYLGGIVGIMVVMLLNILTTRISGFYLTLFAFIGQLFTGILLDQLIYQSFSVKQLIGGIFVVVGLSLNLYIDREKPKERTKEAPLS